MGLEAHCVGRQGQQASAGKALLETDYLLFRGDFRVKIPFAQMTSVKADGGQLVVRYADGSFSLELGPAASKWADKILHPPQRLDKLGVKPGLQIVILGVVDKAFHDEVASRTTEISTRTRKNADIVFLGAATKADLRKLAALRNAIKPDGAVWVIYPKGIKEITENDVLAASKEAGLVDVKIASFSSTHTALKSVIPLSQRQQPP